MAEFIFGEIPIENIIISKDNARKIDIFLGLDELAENIKAIGRQER